MPQKPPPPPVYKPKPKKKEKTPAEVARRSDAIRREREKLYGPRERAAASIRLSKEKERLTGSQFASAWNSYNEIYQSYAGRNATQREARGLIANGVSRVTLAKHLAKLPAFYKSPIWKAQADGYLGVAKTMGVKVDKQFVAKAIASSWDSSVFQEKLRKSPSYLKSNEFRSTAAGLTNAYRSLYGNPDPEWTHEIQRAALARWTPDQWDSYLRAHPNYRNSFEYQNKLQGFQSLLGYAPTRIREPQQPGGEPPPPDDRRVR